jgi:hypothetical protein
MGTYSFMGASNYRLICPIPLARTPQIRFCGDHGI